MPTIAEKSNEQKQRATEAQLFALHVVSKLMGEPPPALVQASLEIATITVAYTDNETTLQAAALLPYFDDKPQWGQHWPIIRKAVPESLGKLLQNVIDLQFIDQLQREEDHSEQQEAYRRMLLAMVNDLRCVIVKLAQHLQKLRNAKSLTEPEQQRVAQRSFSLYAPLANRLGIWQLKWEVEDLGFRYSQPNVYKQLAKQLKETRIEREQYIEQSIHDISVALKAQGLDAEVIGRPKHIYSIYRKMASKQLRFDQLFDIRAIRILVKNETQCYLALGAVHSLWKPISGEFDDYVANPKANGYRSIHTAVYAHQGKTLEVQIRTQEMHQQAELGVAAHWRYKEGAKDEDAQFNQKITWLRELLEASKDTDDDLIPSLTQQVFEDHIYVLTPAGDVIDLPARATPVDFAFEIHTQVGYRCRGAKINSNIVPLNTRLNSGDQVEVITAKNAGPSRDWLNTQLGYATTAKSRSRLRAWFRGQDKEENIAAGRDILERELKRLNQTDLSYEELSKKFKKANTEAFLAAVGAGEITVAQLASGLQPKAPETLRILSKQQNGHSQAGIKIQGLGSLLSSLAGCCHPVPGDAIAGFVTRGRGVSIHRQDCQKFLRLQNEHHERVIGVTWGDEQDNQIPVDISIEAWDRYGLLRDISSILANDRVNVLGIRSNTDVKAHKAYITVSVEVENLEALSVICNRVAQVPNVVDVQRA